ncbi:MAG: hypothetical protein ACI4C3_09765 [Bacteroides sp.]
MYRIHLLTRGCLISLATLLLSACNSGEKEARALLKRAETAYEQGHYQQSIAIIDSIKSRYPKAFDTRRESQLLMRKASLQEQEQNVAFLDSVIREKQILLSEVSGLYLFEKDTAYQQLGNYIHPSQLLEKNLHRAHLSFRTNERGELTMTSIYCGKQAIHHSGVKVIAPDGTYMETPTARETYESSVLGEQIEKSDFRLGEDGGVMEFIYRHAKEKLKLEFKGDRSFTTQMTPADCEALVAVYDLAHLLDFICEMQSEREANLVKIRFIKKQMEEGNELPKKD